MGHEALALSVVITLILTYVVLFALRREQREVREELRRMRKGLNDLAQISVRTNMYAQQAIAKQAAERSQGSASSS